MEWIISVFGYIFEKLYFGIPQDYIVVLKLQLSSFLLRRRGAETREMRQRFPVDSSAHLSGSLRL